MKSMQHVNRSVPVLRSVSGAVIREGSRALIARRREDDECGLMWEFPGGKQRPNESAKACIRREILEELNLEIQTNRMLAQTEYHFNGFTVLMTFFEAEITGGKLELREHTEVRWIMREELGLFEFMPPDIAFVKLAESWWK